MGPAYSATKRYQISRYVKIPQKKMEVICWLYVMYCVLLAAYSGGVKCSPILCTLRFKSVEEKGIKTRCYAIGYP